MVVEYPKRVYKGDESIVVNTKEEESEYLGFIPIELTPRMPSQEEINKAIKDYEENWLTKNDKEVGVYVVGSGEVQGQRQEKPAGILKRKPGRPHSKI